MASRSLGTLTIDVVAKTGLLEKGMERAARKAESEMRSIERSAQKIGAAVGVGIGALAVGIGLVVRNTMDAQKSIAQLDAILASTGNAAGYTRDQLVSMAQQFQDASTFGSNEIIDAQTRLLSYSGVLGENIPRAMQAIIDQSARLGMSLTQSAETIGRALESPSKAAAALAQQGFGAAFTKEVRATIDALVAAGREAEAQVMILDILEESYGGAAAAARDTLGGALTALKHNLSTLMTGGDGTLSGATKAVNDLNDALSSESFRQSADDIIQALADVASSVTTYIQPVIEALLRLREVMHGVVGQAEGFGTVMRGIFKFDRSEISAGVEAYRQASREIDRAFGVGRQPTLAADQFRNVTGGVVGRQVGAIEIAGDETKSGARSKSMSDEQRAAERLQQAYESLMQTMHQRITLFDAEGEAARVRYETEFGALAALDPLLKQQAIARAEELDQMERLREEGAARAAMAKEETDRIRDGLERGEEVVDNLRAEVEMLSMGNKERLYAVATWGMSKEAVEEYGESIKQLIADRESMMQQIEFMDGMRDSFATFFEDVIGGTASVKDAFSSMLEDINRMILRRISENWVEQLFGAFGTSQGGSAGGGWMQAFAGLFGGGKAGGGWAAANRMYEVNERGMEMASVNGRDYLLTGNKPVEITPNHRLGTGQFVQNVTIPVYGSVDRRTKAQIASDVGRQARLASARNG